MELSVVKPGAGDAGTVSVSDSTFAREYNESLVHQVVTSFLAGARQGTRAQKSRSDGAQALETEGYWPCTSRHHPLANLAFWWRDVCRFTSGSFAQSEQENVSRCDALYLV